jgi:molybdate/tungstate transport system substrate-binding protein
MVGQPRSGAGLVSRRSLLAATGGLAGVGALTAVLGTDSDSIAVLSAGSLAATFEDHIGPAFERETGTTVHGEYYGTNAVMRMIEDGTKGPDVVVSADATLLRDRLYDEYTDWDVEFATNSVGLGYDPGTGFGRRLEAGEPWYELVRASEDGAVAISDPDLDPLGYRAVQAFELAGREHGVEGLREELLASVYMEPEEPQLLAGVETGSRAAAVVYRNMAVDHGLAFHEFPPAYNFADPSMAERYATAEYTTDDGYTAEGRPVVYNATVLDGARDPEAGRRLVQFLADNGDLLEAAGLTASNGVPRVAGDAPAVIDV